MFTVAKDDILRGLKRCKRLAKQDLLASSLTSNPEFWCRQAEARRAKYDFLMRIINEDGVETAYDAALRQYVELPRFRADFETDPMLKGYEQALEMFFFMLGVSENAVEEARKLYPESLQGEAEGQTVVTTS